MTKKELFIERYLKSLDDWFKRNPDRKRNRRLERQEAECNWKDKQEINRKYGGL